MDCKFCGKELADGAAFCPECGKAVEESTVVETATQKKNLS